jgi:hypothetical protein
MQTQGTASVASLVGGFESLSVSAHDGHTLKAPLKPKDVDPSLRGRSASRASKDTLGTLSNLGLGSLLAHLPMPAKLEEKDDRRARKDSKEKKEVKGGGAGVEAEAEATKSKGKSKAEKQAARDKKEAALAVNKKFVKEKIAEKAAKMAARKESVQEKLEQIENFPEVDFSQHPLEIYRILKLADFNEETLRQYAKSNVARNLFQALRVLELFQVNCLKVGIVKSRMLGFVAKHCKELSKLDLTSANLTRAAVPDLMKLDKQLTQLSVQECGHQVSDIAIDRFTQLIALNIANAYVDDAWLERLAPLKALRRLNISGCANISEKGFYGVLENVKALKKLSVRNCKIDSMQFMKRFEVSRMKVERVTEDALAFVVTNPKCQLEVSLTMPCRADSEVQVVQSFEGGLTHLWLTNCGMKINEVSIDKFTQLEGLDASNTNVTDAWLARLANLKALQNLNLSGCNEITEVGVQDVLENRKALRNLNLQQCQHVVPDLHKIFHDRVAIKMSLDNQDKLVSSILRKLGNFENLQGNLLEMMKEAGPTITNLNLSEGILGMVLSPKRLIFLKIFNAIQKLSLKNGLLETNMLPEIGKSFPALRELDVSGLLVAAGGQEASTPLNDEHLRLLLENSTRLRSLLLDHTAVTSKGLSVLNELMKKVTLLSLQGCSELFKAQDAIVIPQRVRVLDIRGSAGLTEEHLDMLEKSNPKLIVRQE